MTRAAVPKHPVLTTASTVTCNHVPFGRVALSGTAKLRVAGAPVLLAGGVGPGIGPGCVKVGTSDVPCTAVTPLTPPLTGLSTKLRAGGSPVVLRTLTAATNGLIGVLKGAVKVTRSQSKLVAP
jgi:hypothetical protein